MVTSGPDLPRNIALNAIDAGPDRHRAGKVAAVKGKTILTLGSLAAGAGLAYGTDQLVRKVLPEKLRLPAASAGLVTAALIYPAFRRRPHKGVAARIEWLAVGATLGTGAASARLSPAERQRAVAAAWASHALFDMAHRRGPKSRIPGWYPAACAGYDLALAGLLLKSPAPAPAAG